MAPPPNYAGSSNKRRSQRVIISVPVSVSGKKADGTEFREDAVTLVVNAHGALIALASKVKEAQSLFLTSRGSPEPQECRVVYVGHSDGGKTQVAVEFLQPAPDFWHIAFPPDDWSAAVLEGKVTPTS